MAVIWKVQKHKRKKAAEGGALEEKVTRKATRAFSSAREKKRWVKLGPTNRTKDREGGELNQLRRIKMFP